MSISTSLDLKLAISNEVEIKAIEIIELLEKGNWNLLKNGEVLYLPIGDDGDYNWTSKRMTVEEIKKIISRKNTNKETIGIALYHKATAVGIEMLYFESGSVSFNLSMNTVYMNKSQRTKILDASWYLKEIVEPLIAKYYCEKMNIEQLGC